MKALRLLPVAMAVLGMVAYVALAGEAKPPTTQPAAKAVNVKCPITGNPIDPAKLTKDVTREFKGRLVGFCCPNCPPVWDKLTDAEKEAKLKAVLPPATKPAEKGA